MTNPFAKAAEQTSGGPANRPATDQLTGNNEGYDPLFGGKSLPSVFNASSPVDEWIPFTITEAPYDKHSRFYVRDGGIGELKYWGDDNKPTAEAVGPRGPRRPVNDTVIPMNVPALAQGEDSGDRGWYIGGGQAMSVFRAALRANSISSRPQLVGMHGRIKRQGSREDGWTYFVELSR